MNIAVKNPSLILNNGVEMPLLGLGVYNLRGAAVEAAVSSALENGYRLIDTATLYGNEREVGRAIKASGLPRSEIFVTTKLFPTNFLWAETAFESSLQKLELDYLDLYLIHWPAPGKNSAWKTLEKLYEKKLTRAIGVSNYSEDDLHELAGLSAVMPAVDQIEFNPFIYRKSLLEFCRSKNIAFEAYSPLNKGKQLEHPVLQEISGRTGKTPAQIILRWSVQKKVIVIPKSAHPERITENSQIFDWELSEDDMTKLDALSVGEND